MALKRMAAEVVGTFVLVFGGVGAAVIAGPKIGNVGVAFAFGLSLLAMACAVGAVSGCHINPAVTMGLLVRGKIELPEAARYWVAQISGGIIAAGVLLAIVAGRKGGYHAGSEGLGANGFGAHSPGGYPWGSAFAAEVVLTAFLVFTVLAATDRITARRSTRAARQWPPRRALSRRSRRGSPRRPSPGRSRSAPAI